MDRVIRGGAEYIVVEQTEDAVAIVCEFSYAEYPHNRQLKLWWDKKLVQASSGESK